MSDHDSLPTTLHSRYNSTVRLSTIQCRYVGNEVVERLDRALVVILQLQCFQGVMTRPSDGYSDLRFSVYRRSDHIAFCCCCFVLVVVLW